MSARDARSSAMIRDRPHGSARAVLLIALLFGVNSVIGPVFIAVDQVASGRALWALDFPSFHMAADSVFNRGLSPYADATETIYRQERGFPVLPFLYPPYALPLFYPLSLLDYGTGMAVLLAVNAVAAFVFFYLIHRLFLARIPKPGAYWAAIVFLFICGSVRETVAVGQVNLIAAVAVLLSWKLLREARHPVLAGALIGIAVVTKTYFLLLAFLLLPRRDWRPIVGVVGVVAAFGICSLVVAPKELWMEWLTDVAPSAEFGKVLFRDFPAIVAANQSVNGVLVRLIGEGGASSTVVAATVAALLVAAGAALWLRRRETADVYFDSVLPLALLTVFLTAPLSWPHHLVFVTPTITALWSDAAVRGAQQEMKVIGALAVWAAAPWPLNDLFQLSPYLTLLPFPGIAALWVLSLRRAARGPQAAPQTTQAAAPLPPA